MNQQPNPAQDDVKIRVGHARTGTIRSLNLRVEGSIPSRLTTSRTILQSFWWVIQFGAS
jgi:hypothetical protein